MNKIIVASGIVEKQGIPAVLGVIIMVAITIIIATLTYQFASGDIQVEYNYDEGFNINISDVTILEIIALIIIVLFLVYVIKTRKKKNRWSKNKTLGSKTGL